VADHLQVLAAAIDQLPPGRRAKLLIRIDGAGATHDPLRHLEGLNTTRRRVYYTVGWVITEADETAIAALLGLHDQPDLAHAEPDTLRYLEPVAPTRPAVPPRPPPLAEHRQHLALGRRVHHLLAAPPPAPATHLTGTNRPPPTRKEDTSTTPEHGNRAPPQRHAAAPHHKGQTGQPPLSVSSSHF
jgi:hypothetical protein